MEVLLLRSQFLDAPIVQLLSFWRVSLLRNWKTLQHQKISSQAIPKALNICFQASASFHNFLNDIAIDMRIALGISLSIVETKRNHFRNHLEIHELLILCLIAAHINFQCCQIEMFSFAFILFVYSILLKAKRLGFQIKPFDKIKPKPLSITIFFSKSRVHFLVFPYLSSILFPQRKELYGKPTISTRWTLFWFDLTSFLISCFKKNNK